MHERVCCFSCFPKPKRNGSKDVPSKWLGTSSRKGKKPSASEDFWSSSFFNMENSVALSQGSISSISTSNHTINPQGSNSRDSEFVNHGLLLWNQTRRQWIGNKITEGRLLEPKLSWNATYESLLGSNKRFPQRIPLVEMVDFLADIWEQEGMY